MDNYFDELNERESVLSDTQIAERYKVCINEAIALGVKPPIHSDEDLRLDARVHRYHIACLESQRKIMGRNIYIFSLLFYSFLFFFILFFTLSFFYILPSLWPVLCLTLFLLFLPFIFIYLCLSLFLSSFIPVLLYFVHFSCICTSLVPYNISAFSSISSVPLSLRCIYLFLFISIYFLSVLNSSFPSSLYSFLLTSSSYYVLFPLVSCFFLYLISSYILFDF